jgi:hypothetical protein
VSGRWLGQLEHHKLGAHQGAHTLTAKQTDIRRQYGVASASLSVTIDTTAAPPSAPNLIAASDSGTSSVDNLTNVTTPTFTGTAEAGAAVTIKDGATTLGTVTATAAAHGASRRPHSSKARTR